MTKIFFVEDEMMIRKAIIGSVDWSRHDIEVVGDAPNGKEALEIIKTTKIDIVITDIKMPTMDGLELATEIRAQYPHMRVIILSGYDDFEYARSAMKLGITDYLLKPVSEDDLIPLIKKIADEIDAEQESQREALRHQRLINENRILIQSKFIQDVLQRNYQNDKQIFEAAEKVGLSLEGSLFGVLIITMDSYNNKLGGGTEKNWELQRFVVSNIFEELFCAKINSVVAYKDENELSVVFSGNQIQKSRLNEFLKTIIEAIRDVAEVRVSISVSSKFDKISNISNAYAEAVDAKKMHFYDKDAQIKFYEAKENKSNVWINSRRQYEKESVRAIEKRDVKEQIELWKKCRKIFEEHYIEESTVKEFCTNLCTEFVKELISLGGLPDEIKNGALSRQTYVMRIQDEKFLCDLGIFMEEIIYQTFKEIENLANKGYSYMIRTAMHYMESNYCKDISLTELAELTGGSANYFSRIFKREVGSNFVDWINRLRIEKAKNILLTDTAKVYEVAELVGYSEYKYFITMFKKYTGVTPKQFRKKGNI